MWNQVPGSALSRGQHKIAATRLYGTWTNAHNEPRIAYR